MSIHDLTERRQFRGRKTVSPDGYITIGNERVYVGHQSFTVKDLARATAMAKHYERHTTESRPFAPSWEAVHDLEARVQRLRAKCLGTLLLGLVVGLIWGYWVFQK